VSTQSFGADPQCVRHLVYQGLCEAEVPAAPGRRISSRQRDLIGQTTSAPRGGHTGFRFGGSTCRVQGGRCASLTRRSRRFDSLPLGDPLDQRRFVG
jgi:hypothetical protein